MKTFVCVCLAFGLGASAASAATPLELYEQGKYEQAVSAGTSEGDARGYALAARAELASEMMREHPCIECLEQAANYARRAAAADPGQPEGHIYLAVTLGYEARIIGTIAARFRGYAQTAKEEIDTAITDDPRNSWAWAALGGWNVEVVRGGGRTLARWLYNASIDAGIADFRKSFALDPDNLVLRYQFALTLAGYDRDRYLAEISSALESAVAGKPRTAYDNFALSRARALLAKLSAGDLSGFDALVHHDQGYP